MIPNPRTGPLQSCAYSLFARATAKEIVSPQAVVRFEAMIFIYFTFLFSPLQDDFIIVHIPGEYDSVLETVFKTEFLTLLSSKYQDSTNRQLKVDISSRYFLFLFLSIRTGSISFLESFGVLNKPDFCDACSVPISHSVKRFNF